MQVIPITTLVEVQTGDSVLIEGDNSKNIYGACDGIHLFKNVTVKTTERDGTEIILQRKNNIYFNLLTYLLGKSWVKSAYIVRKA